MAKRTHKILNEFKEFAIKGNVIDLAIGVVIGASFGKITTSLVNDIIMPPVSALFGRVDFSDYFIAMNGGHYQSLADAKTAGAVTFNYGLFINTLIEFLIIAFALFFVVRMINRLKRNDAPPPPQTRHCEYCLTVVPTKASRCPACTSQLRIA